MSSKDFNLFKDFQSDKIQTSSRKLFSAHYACRNSDLNLTLVTGTTNGFIFQTRNTCIAEPREARGRGAHKGWEDRIEMR